MRILFMGSGAIGLPVLNALLLSTEHQVVGVVAQPDKPVGRKQILTAPLTKTRALEHGVPVLQPIKIRQKESLDEIAVLNPELIVVMAYGQILPKALLDLPKVACLNLHASLLPKYRGASPIQAAILNGDSTTGITLMYMDVGLDTGDILCKKETPIFPAETAGELHDRLADLAILCLQDGLAFLQNVSAPRIPQDSSQATLCGKLDRDSGWIDWHFSAESIVRLVRAMNPWPGAFTFLPDGRKLKVHRAISTDLNGRAGQILAASSGGLIIGCAEGAIQLTEVQVEGRNKMSAGDFLRGNSLILGDTLAFRT